MNRKFCYQSATKFSTVILTRELRCILLEWACGGLSDCEELVGLLKGDRSGVTQTDILVGQAGLEPATGRL